MPAPTLTVDQRHLASLRRAMAKEADGKALRRDLMKSIKVALKPAMDEAKSAIMQMESAGIGEAAEPLRQAIARRITTQVKLSGRSAGAAVRARRRGMPRGFEFAARRTNRKSWRHRVFGRDIWVEQVGYPRWFDDTMKRHRRGAREAVLEAMRAMERRIIDNTRRI